MKGFEGKFERYEHALGRCVTVETEIEVEAADTSSIEVPVSDSDIEMIYEPGRTAMCETDGHRIYFGDSFLELPPEERAAWVAHERHHILHPNADEFECNAARDAELKQNGGWEKFSRQYNLSGEWNY